MLVRQDKGRGKGLRPWHILLASFLPCVAIAWSVLWYVAAHESAATFNNWIAQEKRLGRNWSCPQQKITGFPFAIKLSCSTPHFEGQVFGRQLAGTLNGLVATAKLTNPTVVEVSVASPLAVRSADKAVSIALSWKDLRIKLAGLPKSISTISAKGEALRLRGYLPNLGALNSAAAHATANISRDAESPNRAVAFRIALNGASAPLINALFGTASPAKIDATGHVTDANFDASQTMPQALDRWRTAGGHIQFANLEVTRGATKLDAHGALTLGPTHRLQGGLETTCLGFVPVLRRLGVNPAFIVAGTLLTSFLGGPSKAASSGPQPLHLFVRFDSGRVSIGPVRTSIRLPPLY